VKFWGKIFGTQKDYYIIEARVDPSGEQEEITENHEARGTGVNKKVYFVSNDITDPAGWTELPLILPKHLIQARKIRYTFTGNLEQNINTSPVFPGKEKHYVKL
jgi:radial spoke head protein 4A